MLLRQHFHSNYGLKTFENLCDILLFFSLSSCSQTKVAFPVDHWVQEEMLPGFSQGKDVWSVLCDLLSHKACVATIIRDAFQRTMIKSWEQ